jgi:hypothetical protein
VKTGSDEQQDFLSKLNSFAIHDYDGLGDDVYSFVCARCSLRQSLVERGNMDMSRLSSITIKNCPLISSHQVALIEEALERWCYSRSDEHVELTLVTGTLDLTRPPRHQHWTPFKLLLASEFSKGIMPIENRHDILSAEFTIVRKLTFQ